MSYINFKGTVKKINLKSADETEITISIPAEELDGQYNTLQSMLELKVIGGLDSQIVTYKVMKNAKTGQPLTKYTVDNGGVVSVAQPEGEQLSMDLGLPPEKVEVKAEPEHIDLEVIQAFILNGLAPHFEDMDYDFQEIEQRLLDGETYLKIAADVDMGVGVFVVMVDEYRKRVAPMAAKWDEWRQGQAPAEPAAAGSAPGPDDKHHADSEGEKQEGADPTADGEGDGLEGEASGESASGEGGESGGADQEDPAAEVEVSKEALDEFILKERPLFPEIEFNGEPIPFPDLLEKRKREDKVWRDIAIESGMTSGQLSSKWSAYRKLAAKKMQGGGGAA
ncbi:hypothetical protein SAMN04487895_104255 [Paenibacillus sophorae]|uniref:Uncharacterized protein n=1 Tax=Paenibacillus sophorae TaxID=1333845 RepID=A0A1H8LA68_9BACL|nr:hypothetical protein [Paenibacillus sophorae]QWU17362.1 hypothetical protein KP014_09520 [Paenibacillus sophorae]SEO02094.1 hypothetical protein SAMN04487895_104255 [Paenibacillus sophorae]